MVRKLMFDFYSEYDFAVTDSKEGLEILVGWRRNTFSQVIWTQKRDFQNDILDLRPGGLLSVNFEGELYNLLFLHTDSGATSREYKIRKEMFSKVWKLKTALEKANEFSRANMITLGDLNTMGNGSSISGRSEIRRLNRAAKENGMRMLKKDQEVTWHQWSNGPKRNRRKLKVSDLASAVRSNLDHVIVSEELKIETIDQDCNEIKVYGWNQLNGIKLINFLWNISDHSALFGKLS
ncbi:MAG: hypothetical protein DHS20C13_08740 [Thermodesulfobacteriota bacterium]|nr:MAG: hypothetical protein DHS20C13_08740 [Thermodesulfobacteriota bacterium]